MPATPVPVPETPAAPADALSALFATTPYDAQGAMGGLFAPAYVKGYQPSEDAVGAWRATHRSVTPDTIEQSRMPQPYMDPYVRGGSSNQYGNAMPMNLSFSDARGMVDPAALRAASMGGTYDLEGRRNAIAQRLQQNAAADQAAQEAQAARARQQQWWW